MTIRARLTLWYAGILFVSVLIITGLAYREFKREQILLHSPHPNDADNDSWQDIAEIGLACGLPAALLGLVGGWWLMRRAMAPVAALTAAAARIHESNLHQQLPRTGNGDELDRLTGVFNDMTARLANSFNRIREFTLHASHELKTPLTIMHGEVETALRAAAPGDHERLLSHLDEIQRLAKIVDGLTLLTKADSGMITLARDRVALDELVRDSHDDAQILAQPSGLHVRLGECAGATVLGDRHRLRQLLLNLTDNAVKYNQPGGSVVIGLRRDAGCAELTVTNTGPGIPAEFQGRVFDRFFRGDAAHSTAVDGCGLGLSIAQWIVQAHQGTIAIQSQPGGPTTVTVRLPAVA